MLDYCHPDQVPLRTPRLFSFPPPSVQDMLAVGWAGMGVCPRPFRLFRLFRLGS